MSFHPKISIVIPVYNGAKYLLEAIESALAQTYNNIEVLVVNDGSSDNGKTREIALSFENRIRYFEKENGGVATALNLGIQNMSGEYFSWLSHDDVYYPHKLETQVDYLRDLISKELILYGDYDLIDSNSQHLREVRLPHYEPEQFLYELIQSSFLHGCTMLIPKICFECVGQFNEKLLTTQDYELWVKLAKRYAFIHLPDKVIKSRRHSEQGTNQLKDLHLEEDDQFHVWFVNEMVAEKIPRLYNIPASIFYLKLAISYQQRQFFKAACTARRAAIKLAKDEGIGAYVKIIILNNNDRIKPVIAYYITSIVKKIPGSLYIYNKILNFSQYCIRRHT